MQGFRVRTNQLQHQCGAVYTAGNLQFSSDGSSLLTIASSRVQIFGLGSQTCRSLSAQARSDLSLLALHPDQQHLLQVDGQGYAQLVLLRRDTAVGYYNFHGKVTAVSFSGDGRFLAIAIGGKLRVFECGFEQGALLPYLSFSSWSSLPLTHLNWMRDYLVTCSEDMTVRLCHLGRETGKIPVTLSGHRKSVLGAYELEDHVYTCSADARVFVWRWTEADDHFVTIQSMDYRRRVGHEPRKVTNNEQLELVNKHQLQHEGSMKLSAVDMKHRLLVVGFVTGNFALYSVSPKTLEVVHTLNMTEYEISSIQVNNSGDWVAFASKTLGQLLVWEWKSETYVLKQSGHSSAIMCAAISPDSRIIASGGVDGKIKLWENGICFASFNEHTLGVIALRFTHNNTLISAGQDSTIRAFDTSRYKQFRQMSASTPVNFLCLAVDRAGDLIAAGAEDYNIYLWAVHTGALCEVLSGHTAPVSCLEFTMGNALVSGSWDKSVRVWDVIEGKAGVESVELNSEALALSIRNDSKQIAVSMTNGEISFFMLPDLEAEAGIQGKRDIAGGRGTTDRITAEHNAGNKRFTSLAYSPDGGLLLAAGVSKYLCLYDLKHRVLLSKLSFTENRSLSGVLHKLNSKEMTEVGPKSEFDLDEYNYFEDYNEEGVREAYRPGELNKRKVRDVKANSVYFAENGRCFAVVTTEGLMVYSVDSETAFLPRRLAVNVSRENVVSALVQEKYASAMVIAAQLGDQMLFRDVLYRIPDFKISEVTQQLAGWELLEVLRLLATEVPRSPSLGFILRWVKFLLKWHSKILHHCVDVKALQRGIQNRYEELERVCRSNQYLLQYLAV